MNGLRQHYDTIISALFLLQEQAERDHDTDRYEEVTTVICDLSTEYEQETQP